MFEERCSSCSADSHRYSLRASDIEADLTTERPAWPFSCYGPGLKAPTELMTAEREESMEENRMKYYINVAEAVSSIHPQL